MSLIGFVSAVQLHHSHVWREETILVFLLFFHIGVALKCTKFLLDAKPNTC